MKGPTAVGCRCHPVPHRRGLALPGRGHRFVVPPGDWLVHWGLGHYRWCPGHADGRHPQGRAPAGGPPLGRGAAYTSLAFSQRITELELHQSFGKTGDCRDSAAAEAFFATLKRELAWIHRTERWRTKHQFRGALFDYIEDFYNPQRIQRRLGHRSPIDSKEQSVEKPVSAKAGQAHALFPDADRPFLAMTDQVMRLVPVPGSFPGFFGCLGFRGADRCRALA